MKAEDQYNMFNESGDLKQFFPNLSGDWKKDEKKFTTAWNKNNQIIERALIEDSFLDEED